MTTSRNNEASISGPAGQVSLGDLRWMLAELGEAPDDHIVRVKLDQGFNQMDPGSTTLSSQVPPRRPLGRPIKDSPQA